MFFLSKALHFIGLISWFSGVFYLGRLLIYLYEAQTFNGEKKQILTEQFLVMTGRVLKAIVYPAMVITFFAGLSLAVLSGAFAQPWFHLKFLLVILLIAYTLYCARVEGQFRLGNFMGWSSVKLRYLNEVATLFLVVMVVLGVFRQGFFTGTVLVSLGVFSLFIMWMVYRVNK